MDEFVFVFDKLIQWNFMSIVPSPPLQGLTRTRVLPPKEHIRSCHPFTQYFHGVTFKPCHYTFTSFVQADPMSRVPSTLVFPGTHDQLPTKPCEISLPFVEDAHTAALWHSNCLFTRLCPPLDCELAAQVWSPSLSSSLSPQCPAQGLVYSGCSGSIC